MADDPKKEDTTYVILTLQIPKPLLEQFREAAHKDKLTEDDLAELVGRGIGLCTLDAGFADHGGGVVAVTNNAIILPGTPAGDANREAWAKKKNVRPDDIVEKLKNAARLATQIMSCVNNGGEVVCKDKNGDVTVIKGKEPPKLYPPPGGRTPGGKLPN